MINRLSNLISDILSDSLVRAVTRGLTDHESAFGRLPQWFKAVRADALPSLHTFINGLERDLAAVTAGLTLAWSSEPDPVLKGFGCSFAEP
ncbi:hypothetical protein ACFWNT_30245 [Streptomyces sp. NPDC058409]|uniref:hypothetical protein n=1 Tax=Streptomyces sp. NPDC058409 TaxID=3346484 RepID=UPI0036572A28